MFAKLSPLGTRCMGEKELTCAVISRTARPVCSVSIFASSGTRASRSRARFDSTPARCTAGARDQVPALKTSCALNTAFSTSSWFAQTTLCSAHPVASGDNYG